MSFLKDNKLKLYYILFPILVILSILNFSGYTVDDAFISYRFGENLIQSGCWDYNPDCSSNTNPLTSLLYGLISIIPALFSINIVLFFKVFALLILISYLFYIQKYFKTKFVKLSFFIFFPQLIVICFSGIETFLFSILLSIFFSEVYMRRNSSSTFILSLLILTRPEALVILLLYPIYLFRERISLKYILLPIITTICYFVFNLAVFNDLLPSSFYYKSHFNYNDFIRTLFYFVLIILPLFYIIFKNSKSFNFTFLVFLTFSVIMFKYLISSLDVNFSYRFYYQLIIPIYVISVITFENSSKISSAFKNLSPVIFCLFLALTHRPSVLLLIKNEPQLTEKRVKISNYISSNFKNPKIICGEAGIIPYYTDGLSLDLNGLTNIGILKNGYDLDFIKSQDFEFAFFLSEEINSIERQPTINYFKEFYFELPTIKYYFDFNTMHIFSKKYDQKLIDYFNEIDEYEILYFSNSLKYWTNDFRFE